MVSASDVSTPGTVLLATAFAAAVHQDDTPCVLVDPLAKRIVALSDVGRNGILPGGLEFGFEMRLAQAMEQRFADDVADAAVASGISQFVVFNAGLDTICYRHEYPAVRLFEVNRRAVQRWKRQRLSDAGIDPPQALTFVPLDDDRELGRSMRDAGHDPDRPTVVVWLKKLFMTQREIVDTFGWLRDHRAYAEIVTDYLQPPQALSGHAREALMLLRGHLAAVGQPMDSFADTTQITSELREYGFDLIEDLSWRDLVVRYAPTQMDSPDFFGGHHLVHAKSVNS